MSHNYEKVTENQEFVHYTIFSKTNLSLSEELGHSYPVGIKLVSIILHDHQIC